MSEKPLISVALDFGTTYSGYAYSTRNDFQKDPSKLFANESWPAGTAGFSKKTPTALLLDPDKNFHSFGYEAEQEYANLAIEGEHKQWYFFRRFKMKLHGEKGIKSGMQLEDETGKPLLALKIFSESIGFLKRHFMEMVEERGLPIYESEIKWILTVPAIWNDAAKGFMKLAAVQAGLDEESLLISLEPEAASIFCQHIELRKSGNEMVVFEPGTRYMVVDLGGGTADITIHEKQANGCLKEIAKASGGAWGGNAVDEKYLQLLTRVLGGPVIHRFRHESTDDFLDMMREFEIAKRNVKPKARTSFNVRLPSRLNAICIEENGESIASILKSENCPFFQTIKTIGDKLSIKMDLIMDIFNDILIHITEHIELLLNATNVSTLLLVGGFSESPLVQAAMKEKFQISDRHVIVPFDPGLTVVKGAVLFGHNPKCIEARVMRYTYGIEIQNKFDEDDPIEKRKLINDVPHCVDIFSSFIEVGTEVNLGHTVVETYTTQADHYDFDKFNVFVSSDENTCWTTEEGCRCLVSIDIKDMKPNTGVNEDLIVTYTFGNTEIDIEIYFDVSDVHYRLKCDLFLE